MEQAFYSKPWQPNFAAHPNVADSALECVLIEPRIHQNLDAVIRNMSCMVPYASLTILHSKVNEDHIVNNILGGNTHNINLRCFTESNINKYEYNQMLCTPEFWSSFSSPKVMFFQTDSGVRKNNVLRFMEFDYIGAPWHWQIYGDPHIHIGNGGFSIRTPSVMRDISSLFQRNPHYHDKELGEPEDIFFARSLVHMNNARLPTYDEASMFSVEHNRHPDPMGFHQAYAFHPKEIVKTWMTETDPPVCAKLMKICDAWIESDAGRQWMPSTLKPWLSLGIGPTGFRMAKDTFVSCITHDIHPGYKKWLKIRFEDKEVHIPLYQNRCKEDINVAP